MTEPIGPQRWLEWQWKLEPGVCPEVILEMRTLLSSEARTGSGAPLPSQRLRLYLPVGVGRGLCGGCSARGGGGSSGVAAGRQSHLAVL